MTNRKRESVSCRNQAEAAQVRLRWRVEDLVTAVNNLARATKAHARELRDIRAAVATVRRAADEVTERERRERLQAKSRQHREAAEAEARQRHEQAEAEAEQRRNAANDECEAAIRDAHAVYDAAVDSARTILAATEAKLKSHLDALTKKHERDIAAAEAERKRLDAAAYKRSCMETARMAQADRFGNMARLNEQAFARHQKYCAESDRLEELLTSPVAKKHERQIKAEYAEPLAAARKAFREFEQSAALDRQIAEAAARERRDSQMAGAD